MSEALGQAFVKVQNLDNSQTYAGCGLLIDSEHIVTCTHVLESANGDQEPLRNGKHFVVDMPFIDLKNIAVELIDFIPVKQENITFSELDDIALLKLLPSADQSLGKPNIKIPKAYSEKNNKIQIYSHKSKSWVGGEAVSPTEEGWLVINTESEVERGDSGSPVWNDKIRAITGILVARQRRNLRCYMVSMWKIADAFKGKVKFFQEAMVLPYIQHSDEEYLENIVNNIAQDLKHSSDLQEQIIIQMQVNPEYRNKLNQYLVDLCRQGEMIKVIQGLQSALVESIDHMLANSTPSAVRGAVLNSASALLSKLVLFNIRDNWMRQYLEESNIGVNPVCQLPELDLSSIEIITNRQFQVLPKLHSGRNEQIHRQVFDKGVLLESGIKSDSAIPYLLKQLYCKVMKGINVDEIQMLDSKQIDHLRKTIRQRQQQKNWKLRENYFVVISSADNPHRMDLETQQKLSELIPELLWIKLESKGTEEILITDDIELKVAIDDFFHTLESYKSL